MTAVCSLARLAPCLCFVVSAFLLLSLPASGALSPGDRMALVDLKNMFPSVAKAYGWIASPNCTNWGGITCDSEKTRVIAINITCPDLQVNGTGFPRSFTNLTSLSTLSMSKCGLNFSMPSGFFVKFQSLKIISLMHDMLQGSLPSSLADLPVLTALQVGYNQFSGSIPSLVTKLANKLQKFDISDNRFQNDLSDLTWLGDMKKLLLIDISNNNFIGQIPPKWANITSLQTLDLAENSITGPFPLVSPGVGSWNLTKVNISYNFLEGNATAFFNQYPNLKDCNIAINWFSECTGSSPCCDSFSLRPTTASVTTSSTTLSTSSSSSSSSTSSSSTTGPSSCYPPYTCQCSSALIQINGTTCDQGIWEVDLAVNSGTVIVGSLDEVLINGNYTQGTQAGLIIYSDPSAVKTPIIVEQNAIIAGTLTIILVNPIAGKSNITVINAADIQGTFNDIQIQTSYSQSLCSRIAFRPIYESTGVLLELTTRNTCSNSDRRNKIIIGVAGAVAALSFSPSSSS